MYRIIKVLLLTLWTWIYPRTTLQSLPSFFPGRGSLTNQTNKPFYPNQIIKMAALNSLFKINIKNFVKLSKALWSPPSSPTTSTPSRTTLLSLATLSWVLTVW